MNWLANFVFKWLSGDPSEYCVPPGSEVRKLFGEKDDDVPMFTASTYNNDGFELWICYTRDKWLVHFRRNEALELAWIIVWDWWIKSTWFGLKRKIWYWSLHQVRGEQYHVRKWRDHLEGNVPVKGQNQ